jgi:predicted TIM-barrel fold metal-dependent hydrolase
MIVDAHCHAWETWPYQPPVPDPQSRGRVEQLLFEMDENGVGRAVVICAGIDHNPDNNAYVHEAARRHPGRLVPVADVDSRWLATHNTPGAAGRLRQAVAAFGLVGFTHYLRPEDDGSWLLGEDGAAFLDAAADTGLILSLACGPAHLAVVARVAARWPIPILLHHLGRPWAEASAVAGLATLLTAARHPNLHVKVSGFGYASDEGFPYPGLAWITRGLYEAYGPDRLMWGSDYPVVRRVMTYAQSLDVARRHFAFAPEADRALIFGGTIERLLAARGA